MIWWKSRSSWASQSHVHANGSMRPAGRPIAVRERRVVDAAWQRLECGAVGVLGGREGHRLCRAAVEPAAEPDDHRAVGGDARELDRGLDRLRARIRQERLPRATWQHAAQPVVQAQSRLVVGDVLLRVDDLRGLRRDGRRDPRVRVTRVRHPDPRRIVEVAGPVAGDQPRPLAAVDVEVGDPAPDRGHDGVVGQGSARGLIDHR